MGAHLKENYEEYHDQSIPVLVIHLAKERSSTVRDKILELLMSEEVETDDVIEPLNKEVQKLTLEIKKGSSPSLIELYLTRKPNENLPLIQPYLTGEPNENLPLIEPYLTGEPNENLVDMIKLLVAVLGKMPPEKLDLSKVFLVSHSEYINLKNAKLEGADLNRAILRRVDLTKAVLQGANLEDALLTEVILKNADLGGARLARANLASDDLRNAKFVKADLCGAILQDANMTEAILDKANMFGADLTNAILEHASLRSANMTVAHLELANLKDASLQNANLSSADLSRADLTGANLASAKLSGADLSRADLTGAYLTDANLAAATLQGAVLEVKDIEGANLENADLRAKVLFGIDSKKFQSDLYKGTISEGFQHEFEYNRIYLSENTSVSVEEKDHRWLINDKDNNQTYTVRKEECLNICTEPNIVETELFGIDSKFQNDLDKRTISEDLRQDFENNRIDLSQNTSVSVEVEDKEWLINDKDYEQAYIVKKVDVQLKIYERTTLDPTELFSVDSKMFKNDLDKVTISEDFQKEFENNGISLSQNTTVSIDEKDHRWLINDKDNKQTYTVRKEERLNIYQRTKFEPTDIKEAKNWQKAIFDDDVRQKLLSQQK